MVGSLTKYIEIRHSVLAKSVATFLIHGGPVNDHMTYFNESPLEAAYPGKQGSA